MGTGKQTLYNDLIHKLFYLVLPLFSSIPDNKLPCSPACAGLV